MKIIAYLFKLFLFKKAMNKAKNQSILVYLKALQIARRSLIGSFLLFFCLQAMVWGFIGLIIALTFLFTEDSQQRLWIFTGVSAVFFTVPFVVLAVALSERVWFKASGAERMLQENSAKTD